MGEPLAPWAAVACFQLQTNVLRSRYLDLSLWFRGSEATDSHGVTRLRENGLRGRKCCNAHGERRKIRPLPRCQYLQVH